MSSIAVLGLAAADAEPLTDAGKGQLLTAAILGIAVVVILISWAKWHPFLALIMGAGVMGLVAGVSPADVVTSFTNGFGKTTGAVGLLVALGAMIGTLLRDSGGSETIVDKLIGGVGPRKLPWMMALIAFILGIPLFFEVGVVLLVPVVILVARKLDLSLMKVGIPALAGLSVLHGFVPPHPGPLVAIDALGADMGTTLIFGLIVAIPTLIVSGPLLANFVDKMVPKHATAALAGGGSASAEFSSSAPAENVPGQPVRRRPGFFAAVASITLPVVLMLLRAVAELWLEEGNQVRSFLEFLGNPPVALLLAVLVAMAFLGFGTGMNRSQVEKSVGSALPGIAGILLIVAAGGGFKQMLVDAGVGGVIGEMAEGSGMSPLVLGWLVAVGIRLATGSATVATITAAGIVSPLAADLDKPTLALLVLAIGAGSLFFSHVNDAGFWLVKEYFGMTIGETIKSWSLMETVISVTGLIVVLIFNAFI